MAEIYQSGTLPASAGVQVALRRFAHWLAVVTLLVGARSVVAQVPYVPTPNDVVERMLALAQVGPNDYLIDLGAGDGRIVRTAAKRYGARGFGVDLDAELVRISTDAARRDGVADRVTFMARDLFETDISDATVLTMYLLPSVNTKLRPRLLERLRPGTRVLSHDFDLGDWEPDQTVRMHSPEKYSGTGGNSTIYLWVVPANAAGRWQWRLQVAGQPVEYALEVTQRFQRVQAVLRVGAREIRVEDARLAGDVLTFTATADLRGAPVRHVFNGRVAGDAITGTIELSGARMAGTREWSAARTERRGMVAAPARIDMAFQTR